MAPTSEVDAVLTAAAVRAERIISGARLGLVVLVTLRSVAIWIQDDWYDPRLMATTLATFLLVGGASLFAIFRLQPTPRMGALLVASVVLDALACFESLASNVFYPHPAYPGLIRMPDLGALTVVVLAAGLRLSVPAAVAGGALNIASFGVLMVLDRAITGPRVAAPMYFYTMHLIFLVAIATMAIIVAGRTRRLVERGARAAVQAVQAQRTLGTLLREHHDVRSQLNAAALNADLLVSELRGRAGEERAQGVRAELQRVTALIEEIKDRALLAIEPPVPVELAPALEQVLALVRERFPGTELRLSNEAGDCRISTVGGPVALRSVLFNVLVNACEGDGKRGSHRVEVHIAARAGRVRVEVADDGPGFTVIPEGASTKARGWGLGLSLVESLLRASAGTLERANRPEGGARVAIELPAA